MVREISYPGLQVAACFEHFAGLPPFDHSATSTPAWDAAVEEFRLAMAPIEQRVARTLTARFSSSGLKASGSLPQPSVLGRVFHGSLARSQAHGLLREFVRYRELISREVVFIELAATRETLLGQLEQQVYANETRCGRWYHAHGFGLTHA